MVVDWIRKGTGNNVALLNDLVMPGVVVHPMCYSKFFVCVLNTTPLIFFSTIDDKIPCN